MMTVRSESNILLSEAIRIGEGLPAEAIDDQDMEARFALRFLDSAAKRPAMAMEAARPNPFTDQTLVSVNLERDEPVTLRVFDLLGRQVWIQQLDLTQGTHQIAIPGYALGRSGTYRLMMETPSISPISQHLVLIDE